MLENQENKGIPDSLVQGYKNFLQNDFSANEHLFARLESEGQAPKVMWIGCADSRVSPELILGAEPGELFILRNVANIVPPSDAEEPSVASALVFAVNELKVNHIVVCGHSDCGGVKALSQLDKSPMNKMLSSWIEYARPALSASEGDDLDNLVKANVVVQAERLLDYDFIRSAAKAKALSIHPCYYNIGTGELQQYDPSDRSWQRFE